MTTRTVPLYAEVIITCLMSFSLNPEIGYGQVAKDFDPCDAPTQAVSTLFKDSENQKPEILFSIAHMAKRARTCYGESHTQRVIWLLNKEVWSLMRLKHYKKAETLVDLFYEKYLEASTDENHAHFALNKLVLLSRQGDFIEAAISYKQAERYIMALPLERQIHLLLDGAYVYSQADSYHKVLEIAKEAEALATNKNDTPVSPVVYARVLAVKGEATFWLEREKSAPDSLVLARVIKDLERVRTIFNAHKTWPRYLSTTITLGRVYSELGDINRALTYFKLVMTQARKQGDIRAIILTHLRRGNAYLRYGILLEAENDFTAGLAFADSTGYREFDAHLRSGLTEIQEARKNFKTQRPWGIAIALFLLLTSIAYRLYKRHHTSYQGEDQSGTYLAAPKDLLAFNDVSPRLYQRLNTIALVLHDFSSALRDIDDPVLKKNLSEGLVTNSDLFKCVAAMEEKATGRTFENDPANTLGRHLRHEFRNHHIPWPQTPEAWRRLLGKTMDHKKP